jgi:hypothetical protein
MKRFALQCNSINWAADFEGKTWDIAIGPGVDPCLICCVIAVMDEMKENRKSLPDCFLGSFFGKLDPS